MNYVIQYFRLDKVILNLKLKNGGNFGFFI